jgi:hypothetical protein
VAAIVLVAVGLGGVVLWRLRSAKTSDVTTVQPTPAPTAAPTVVPTEVPAAPPTPAAAPSDAGAKESRVASARPSKPRDVPPEPAPRLPRPQSFLGSAGLSGDTRLEDAYRALDNSRKSRLSREDFVTAMGAARTALATNPSFEVRVLDAYSRAGVAFADGNNATAWQLLGRVFQEAPALARGRVLGFVDRQMRMVGPNPGLEGSWVLGLAFCDVRGDLGEELSKAAERAPSNARVRYARALAAWQGGRPADAVREARLACDGGLSDACDLTR